MPLSSKDPLEKVILTFDFTITGEAVSNPEITVAEKGTAIDIPAMKASGGVISGSKVSFMLQGGTHGKAYDVRCMVDLANGERVAAKDVIQVKTL